MATIANVIEANSPGVLDYLIYPDQNPINQSYLYQQVANVATTFNEIGKRFMEGSREIYERINNADMIRKAKAAIRSAVGITFVNEIYYYNSLEAIMAATPYMQNFIMANPTIRELYNNQLCDGYNGTYIDIDPGYIGDTHYHYRRVMDGVIQDIEDADGNYQWIAKTYMDELFHGDRELDISEKSKILATWEVMDLFIKQRKDPTKVNGGNL